MTAAPELEHGPVRPLPRRRAAGRAPGGLGRLGAVAAVGRPPPHRPAPPRDPGPGGSAAPCGQARHPSPGPGRPDPTPGPARRGPGRGAAGLDRRPALGPARPPGLGVPAVLPRPSHRPASAPAGPGLSGPVRRPLLGLDPGPGPPHQPAPQPQPGPAPAASSRSPSPAGLSFELAWLEYPATRGRERRLKNQGSAYRRCPLCRGTGGPLDPAAAVAAIQHPARGAAVIARPAPGRPAPGGGLAVLVVVTVLAVLAAPQLGRLRPLVDQLRQVDPPRPCSPRPTPPSAAGGVCPVKGPVRIGQGWGAPRDGGRRRHQGIDLLAPAGTPLVAVASGTITRLSNRDRGRGGISLWLRDAGVAPPTTTPTTTTTWSASASGCGPGSCWPGSAPPATPAVAHPISTSSSIPAVAGRSARTRWCGGGADDPGRLAGVGAVAAAGRPGAAPQPDPGLPVRAGRDRLRGGRGPGAAGPAGGRQADPAGPRRRRRARPPAPTSPPATSPSTGRRPGAARGCPGACWPPSGKVESDHGRSRLPGVRSGWNAAGAAGPMQFGIGIGRAGNAWARYGADFDGDGRRSVYDPGDAIPAAARLPVRRRCPPPAGSGPVRLQPLLGLRGQGQGHRRPLPGPRR